ncbi:MAG: dTDP-4-dehydrorhamnose 3,5-epimerase family protein [Pseudomonadales bacterium]|nr:dTDP-4-dehydrorhamnose 3,5-epimerase family protein [Candidatus Woesebacteria bacterium]MCB9802209.1 dTDP-4-dehydrorhamnose 3,5-epimerase family protein [Pseudomonadales bacterium]
MTHSFFPTPSNQVDEYIYQTPITGLWYIAGKRFDDERGFYAELFRTPELDRLLETPFTPKQTNLSHSKQHVIRGIHAENWNKLLTVTQGSCFAAWVDVRKESDTYGHVITATLGTGENAMFGSMFVSSGIGNSFVTLSDNLDYIYTVDQLYAERDTSGDVAISVFDQALAIPWPGDRETYSISDRDRTALTLAEWEEKTYAS